MAKYLTENIMPAVQVSWLRVVLDEGHTIRNASTQQAQAAAAVKAERHWIVSGTPIQVKRAPVPHEVQGCVAHVSAWSPTFSLALTIHQGMLHHQTLRILTARGFHLQVHRTHCHGVHQSEIRPASIGCPSLPGM